MLELVLIVSMKKLLEKDITTFNFEMVYDEYKDFMNRTQVSGGGFGVKLYKRPVALKVGLSKRDVIMGDIDPKCLVGF